MQLRFLKLGAGTLAVTLLTCLTPSIAQADDHLPIIDIQPIFTTSETGHDVYTPGTTLPGPGGYANNLQTGFTDIGGTVTIPLVKRLSFSYDRIVNGLYNATFAPVNLSLNGNAIPGEQGLEAGSYRDVVQQYRLDAVLAKNVSLEVGLASRMRECCPGAGDPQPTVAVPPSIVPNAASSTQWHQAYAGLTLESPPITDFLHTVIVYNITGHDARHDTSPADLAAESEGGILDPTYNDGRGGSKNELGISQSATAVVPIDYKHGFTASATYLWGALDYFQNQPFPLDYGIWAYTLNKKFNKVFGLELSQVSLYQRPNQNAPFIGDNFHLEVWSLTADFHLDFNRLLSTK